MAAVEQLPVSDPGTIAACERDYLEKSSAGSAGAADACFRYAWALCHSADANENQRGIHIAETAEAAMLDGAAPGQISEREFAYVRAVGLFKVREYSKARELCKKMLEESPTFRQASTLKELVEEEMVREGLLGIGVASLAVGVVAGVIALACKRR